MSVSAQTIRLPYNFTPRSYQIPVLRALDSGKKRAVIVWHRRAGKEKTILNWVIKTMTQRIGSYYYFFPTYAQGKKVLWEGIDKNGFPFMSHFPPQLIKKKNDSELKIELINGSIFRLIGTDNYDDIVGTNPVGCVFSEFALQDPMCWELFRPILRENGGWAIFDYTPRGKNHGFKLARMAEANPDWFYQCLTIKDTGVVTEADIEEDRREGMSEELINQEYYCSFDGFVQGAYYSKQLLKAREDKRITEVPHVTGQEVYTFWDLGMDDSTTIWFLQAINQQLRFIDYYENSGEGLAHYVKVLKDKPYVYGDHYLPHDVEVRELGTGKSRRDVLNDLGLRSIITVQRARDIQSVLNGIEAGRNIISQCWFDDQKCNRGLTALESYHANYDEDKKKLDNKPAHDWSSHGADAFRTFAVGYTPTISEKTIPELVMGSGVGWYGG